MHLLISNLNRLTTSSHVIALLLPFGLVTSARINMNTRNGYSAGTALVEIEARAGHIAIGQLDNIRFMNHYIQLEESVAPTV